MLQKDSQTANSETRVVLCVKQIIDKMEHAEAQKMMKRIRTRVGRMTLSRIMRGHEWSPKADTLTKLADAMNLPIEDIITEKPALQRVDQVR